ncbi:MAG: hypothetical protein IPP08_11930 [Chlorobiota bacterium]|nr:MAG: hypothetical protein IPP08_11930 [Chlorobiota bacterium]
MEKSTFKEIMISDGGMTITPPPKSKPDDVGNSKPAGEKKVKTIENMKMRF